ncbi:MAG: cation:proton antiporter [Bacteroidales bacterium]
MSQIPQLIIDLGYILILAGIITLVFRRLKQPLVLGYVVAGMIAGPAMSQIQSVGDMASIQTWSDIGVIVLLFTLGLEFSFKKLMKVGGTGAITTFFEFITMFAVGYLIGKLLGWSQMNRIFLGGMLTISSTTIILKAYDDMGLKTRNFAHLVFSVLIIEDLVAILELVLFPTLAVSKGVEGSELIFNILKLVFFIVLWFVVGIYLIPSALKFVRRLMSDETLLIVSLGLCFSMVVMAHSVGFSAALGAFVMGSILAETIESERIIQIVKPIKNLFGAIFFVSVGLLVNPMSAWEHIIPIVVISLAVLIIKPLSATIGFFISGQPLKTSMQAGFCLCQIGEFSFIIAAMGLSMGVIMPELYPIAVMVSVITTFTTPYQIRLAVPAYNLLMRKLPQKWKNAIQNYSSGNKSLEYKHDLRELTKKYLISLVVSVTLIIATIIFSFNFIEPIVDARMSLFWGDLISLLLTLSLSAPFIFALVHNRKQSTAFNRLWNDSHFNKGYIISLIFFRYLIALVFLGIIVSHFFLMQTGFLVSTILLILILLFASRRISKRYEHIEERFLNNFNSKIDTPKVFERDLHLVKLTVSPSTFAIGKPLKELKLRERYGINIAAIQRGTKTITIPTREDSIYPYDVLSVIGSDEQLAKFRRVIERELLKVDDLPNVELQQFTICASSLLQGNSIKDTGIREKYGLIIAGIEREQEYIMNPESHIQFEVGDVVWSVGTPKSMDELLVGERCTLYAKTE